VAAISFSCPVWQQGGNSGVALYSGRRLGQNSDRTSRDGARAANQAIRREWTISVAGYLGFGAGGAT